MSLGGVPEANSFEARHAIPNANSACSGGIVNYEANTFERFVNVSKTSEQRALYAEIFNILGRMSINGYGLGTFREVYVMYQGENTFSVYFA